MSEELCKQAVERLRPNYRSGVDDLARDFFTPCMSCCVGYRRAVGYFTSSSLISWAAALPRFVRLDDLDLRLLASPYMTKEDRSALRRVVSEDERLAVLKELGDRILLDALDFARDPEAPGLRLRLFLWLLAAGRLKLRFAYPRHIESAGIYHEKIGVFTFPGEITVAFTGSANETMGGHRRNYESIDVFRSWHAADLDRVSAKVDQFEELWDGQAPGLEVVRPSSEVIDRLRLLASTNRPELTVSENDLEAWRWRHQEKAVEIILNAKNGILEMATGTGKTRTALKIARRLVNSGTIKTIIVAADGIDLLYQWEKDLLALSQALEPPYAIYKHFDTHHESELFILDPEHSILLSSRSALPQALKGLSSGQAESTILVHDEVHALGSPQKRLDLEGLADGVVYRLGLSATPEREYDQEGTEFIENHIGPVRFRFSLEDAIKRRILSPFTYYPLTYVPTDEDRERLARIFRRQAARTKAGDPMSQEELWIELSRVHKTSLGKLPIFQEFIGRHSELLRRSIIFVEQRDYGERVLELVHQFRHDFHPYFATEDSKVLKRFARGDLECLVTCHRLSEGIDIKNLRTVILFSSARSRLETIQRIGRCLRADPMDPSKRANVVDFIRLDEANQPNPDDERAEWLQELSMVEPEG